MELIIMVLMIAFYLIAIVGLSYTLISMIKSDKQIKQLNEELRESDKRFKESLKKWEKECLSMKEEIEDDKTTKRNRKRTK